MRAGRPSGFLLKDVLSVPETTDIGTNNPFDPSLSITAEEFLSSLLGAAKGLTYDVSMTVINFGERG
jgi:hypothetical protein